MFTKVSSGGWLLFVHHLLTVAGSLPNCSANHLLVCCLSAKTALILFRFFAIVNRYLINITSAKILINPELACIKPKYSRKKYLFYGEFSTFLFIFSIFAVIKEVKRYRMAGTFLICGFAIVE